MPTQIVHQLKSDGKDFNYPLERYMTHNASMEMSINLSTLGKFPLSDEDLEKLNEIKKLVQTAEAEINSKSSNLLAMKEDNVYHIQRPSYFDENFDQKKYLKELVSATMQGMKIVEQDSAASKFQKIILLKQALENTKMDTDEPAEKVKTTRTVETDLSVRNKTMDTDDLQKEDNKNAQTLKKRQQKLNFKTKALKVTNEEIQNSESNSRMSSSKNHQFIEITSREEEQIEREPLVMTIPNLSVQIMPSLNIRSQLIEQKIPSLDIYPSDESNSQPQKANNVALIQYEHPEPMGRVKKVAKTDKGLKENEDLHVNNSVQVENTPRQSIQQSLEGNIADNLIQTLRQHRPAESITKHSLDNLKSTNSLQQIDPPYMFLKQPEINSTYNLNTDAPIASKRKVSKLKKFGIPEIQQIYNPRMVRIQSSNAVPQPSFRSNISKSSKHMSNIATQPIFLQSGGLSSGDIDYRRNINQLINLPTQPTSSTEYIPYSKLTVGGYNVHEIQKQIKEKKKTYSTIQHKESIDKSNQNIPIRMQASTSQFHYSDYRDEDEMSQDDPKLLLEGDEDDSENSSTQQAYNSKRSETGSSDKSKSEGKSVLDYADDFDADSKSSKSLETPRSGESGVSQKPIPHMVKESHKQHRDNRRPVSLDLKKQVDVFDFVHYIETRDDSTQSCKDKCLNFKQTQTSPNENESGTTKNERNKNSGNDFKDISQTKNIDITNITLADMLEIQKTLSKLNFNLPSTTSSQETPVTLQTKPGTSSGNSKPEISNHSKSPKFMSLPKNTQTSPPKTSHAMTSPARMISQILSPIFKDDKIDAQTSPSSLNIPENLEIDSEDVYKKPTNKNSRGILSDLETAAMQRSSNKPDFQNEETKSPRECKADALKESTEYTDVSHSESSDTYSLGEINFTVLRKKSFIIKKQVKPGSTNTSFATSSSSDVQIDSTCVNKKSDGELSVGQIIQED